MDMNDWPPSPQTRHRIHQPELGTTTDQCKVIDQPDNVGDTWLTDLVAGSAEATKRLPANRDGLRSSLVAAQSALGDCDELELDALGAATWEAMNSRPARDLPGLRRLLERPSPFTE